MSHLCCCIDERNHIETMHLCWDRRGFLHSLNFVQLGKYLLPMQFFFLIFLDVGVKRVTFQEFKGIYSPLLHYNRQLKSSLLFIPIIMLGVVGNGEWAGLDEN